MIFYCQDTNFLDDGCKELHIQLMKKSESIEVRIDNETKEALYKKAQSEGRSVSGVLRGLIRDYLAPNNISAPRAPTTPERKPFKKRFALTAGTAATLIASWALIPSASAENLKLNFDGEIVSSTEDEGINRRAIQSVIEFDDVGGTINLPVGPSDVYFELTVKAIELNNGEEAADIKIDIIKIDGNDRIVLAKPHIIAPLNKVSRIEIGSDPGTTYNINLTPSQLEQKSRRN